LLLVPKDLATAHSRNKMATYLPRSTIAASQKLFLKILPPPKKKKPTLSSAVEIQNF